ncbi:MULTISPECIES: hypothetical protein [unclassified Tolypothrix]|uniref:hypothetical protein n=1 Tax=unclassified Tolypothrix TaxID=2649714 RepID=UPI0005EAA490|nr:MULTISPECIES: hypothetical protein [unclassified Tolypothrix]EKE96416.1 hypothetical protein FDUTEX481_09762 [Tolypothrix sp. PCC 7601]MBE9084148.1 hypothetical protein [Tolypothrix sp. LEGE 11397]UYD31060.1 hypothetical protein HGR01_39965 [Tolypothrix sp. PCC 7712]BAY96023.1 hypothetical protein NIES3275_81000 [Microchaete diplosiphon NIES-3275]
MYQDFQDIDAIEVQVHSEEECNTQCNAQTSDYYTVDQLSQILGVKRRMVFSYAKTVKEAWHWEPETTFNPSLGKYSQRCLDEMRKLQQLGTNEYVSSVAGDNNKYSPKAGALAKVDTRSTVQRLEAKPLPSLPQIALNTVDTSAIRSRTAQMESLNGQLGDAITQLIGAKVGNKIDELDAKLDDFFTEIEVMAKAQAVKKLQQE